RLTDFIHDGWIGLVAAISSKIEFIDKPLVLYRQHSDQQLGAGLSKWDLSIRERHRTYIENRHLALERLEELKKVLKEKNLPLETGDVDLKIDQTCLHISN